MICPSCGHVNLPGNESCAHCQQDLTPLDRPIASNCVERSLMEDPVSALHPRNPITIRPSTSLHSAIQAMLASDSGTLLVTEEDGKLAGILTERDVLTKVAGIRQDYANVPVREIMTSNPVAVSSTTTLDFALHRMDAGGYRNLPVIGDEGPIGMISVLDMLKHIVELCKMGT